MVYRILKNGKWIESHTDYDHAIRNLEALEEVYPDAAFELVDHVIHTH